MLPFLHVHVQPTYYILLLEYKLHTQASEQLDKKLYDAMSLRQSHLSFYGGPLQAVSARTYNTFITESSMHNRSSLLHTNGHGHYLGRRGMSRRRAMGINLPSEPNRADRKEQRDRMGPSANSYHRLPPLLP